MDLENHIGFLVTSTYTQLNNLLSKCLMEAKIDLPAEQSKLVNFISYHEGITQQELAEWLLKLKPGISRMADQLEQKGYIERISDPGDRRIKRIYLTPKGKSLLIEIRKVQKKVLESLHSRVSESDMEIFKTVIKKIRENAQNQLL
jgi:DNA-binding MarR family transcriptional regulator